MRQSEKTSRLKQNLSLSLSSMVDFFGLITYAVNIPISMANDKVLTELHELLINPLNNAVQYHQAK
ncbi:MAG: hypothetical protein ACJAXH_002703 [Colwellia sp.]|jgi:hypothetical protein